MLYESNISERNITRWIFSIFVMVAMNWQSAIVGAQDSAQQSSSKVVLTSLSSPPSFSSISDITIDEDTSSEPIAFAISSVSPVTISARSSNPDLIPNASIFISFTDPLWQVFVTPAANQFGTATITLTAEDANSVSGKTDFEVTVNPVPDPVTVRLISPSPGQIFLAPGTMELSAETTDPDGRIDRVEFFQSSVFIDRATSAPYTFSLRDVTSGDYRLTAVAVDTGGIRVTSEPVDVSVRSQVVQPREQVDVVEGDLNSSRSVQIPILGLPSQEETITYWTSDGPGPGQDPKIAAIEGIDYLPIRPTELKLDADTLRTTLTIVTLGDVLDEGNKLFFVNWSSPNPAFLVSTQLVVNIIDDDPPPLISIDDVLVSESGEAEFTLTLSTFSLQDVVVELTTENGTAAAGVDFEMSTQLVMIPRRSTSAKFRIPIINDLLNEPNETFFVNLVQTVNGGIGKGSGHVTIIDDDAPLSLSVSDARVVEGNTGTITMEFAVRLSSPSTHPISVAYSTLDGTAKAQQDYDSTEGILVFQPGDVSKTVSVTVRGDSLNEGNEVFFLQLGDETGTTLSDSQAVGTIVNDDPAPLVSIENRSGFEGNTDDSHASFQVHLSSPSGLIVTIDYAPVSGTATAGTDFLDPPGSIAIPSGVTSVTFSIPLIGDTIDEPDEAFFVNLSARNATLPVERVQFTILNDDEPPRLVVPEQSFSEGDSGITGVPLDVQLSSPSGNRVVVGYSTMDGTAFASEDYRALETQTLVFEPGSTNRTISVEIIGDELKEADEVFFLDFEIAANVTPPQLPSRITIVDDDTLAGLSVSDISISEGNSGFAQAVFTVSLSAPAEETVSFDFETMPDTASPIDDFFPTSGSRNIEPGESAATIIVAINSDRLHESDESFLLKLSRPSNVVLLNPQGRAVIRDDDPEPVISVSATALIEGNTAAVNAVVTVSLSDASGQIVSVEYATEQGTATVGLDYFAANGTIEFSPGDVEKSFIVQIFGDLLNEPNETVIVFLRNPINASLSGTQNRTQLTILNDDPRSTPANTAPTISTIGNQNIIDGQASEPVIFTINDEETALPEMTIEATSSDPDLIPVDNIVFGGSGANRSLVLVPTIGQSGTAVITVIVFDSDGLSASTSFEVTVLAEGDIPVVNWAQPSAIIYGVALDATQLNAAVNLPDVNPVYDPSTGTILSAGSAHSLMVTFKRADGTTAVTETVTIDVLKANLTVSANDQTRPYRAENPQLSVSYSGFVNGDDASDLVSQVAISTSAGSESQVGLYPIEVSGATSDNYEIRFVPGVLTVIRATPSIEWENPADIVFGTELSGLQLNASSNVPGEFSYDPPVGTILSEGEDQVLQAFFVPTDRQNYEPAIVTVLISVNSDQPISAPIVKGDFNSDGLPDLIFQDELGSLAAWLMEGPTLTSATLLKPSAASDVKYRMAASGDFNTDGNEDLLFQHKDGTLAVWYMNGTTLTGADLLKPANPGDANWRVTSIADLNCDAHADLVFQHADGTLAVWFMDGINLVSATLMNPSQPGKEWRVAGTSDFNGDEDVDLLFQHDNGALAVWYMSGVSLTSAALLTPSNPGISEWRVVSVVDRNQDGQPDLLFQNSVDGMLAIWNMNGVTLNSAQLLNPPSPGGTWKVAAPR